MSRPRSASSSGSTLGHNDSKSVPESEHSTSNEPVTLSWPDGAVAVIGVACKFAGIDSLEQLWDTLETGKSQCRDLPKDRFPDWRFARRSYVKNFKANTIDDYDAFDHKFFKVASREATFMDPQQRLALQVTYQALESSGYFSLNKAERELDMGYYVATSTNEYHENVVSHPPSAFSLTGSIRPFIAGKVSHHFGWTGPAIMYDTACAASGTALHQACRAVATGECKSAVAGGVNIFVSPDSFQDLAAGHFISMTGASKSFDASADGYCRGEGIAFVVLKKLSAALQDGDPIKGVIASTAVGQNANETSITIPHGPSQMKLCRKALKLAGLDAQDVSYVEAHGTGTPVGDPIEAMSIRNVFSNSTHHHTGDKTYLGSLKSNIGHTEPTSGISGLIKVLLMLQKGIIPQQALFRSLNPAIAPLELDGIEIPKRNIQWTSEFKAACVNNYGASGTNAVMIVTQSPDVAAAVTADKVPLITCPISITAFSPTSLASYCSVLLEYVNQSPKDDFIVNIAYHLSRRKNLDLPYTVCTTISSLQELEDLLRSKSVAKPRKNENNWRPVVMFFGGQTGRTVDVPRAFYDSVTIFRKHLDSCDSFLRAIGACSIFPAIFESEPQTDIVRLHSMLFSAQYASAMAWVDCGLRPARLIGHSFGQLTALCVSGVLSLHDGLRFILERARLIEKIWGQDPGSMIAVEADLDEVTNLLTQQASLGLEIACRNGPRSFVIAGGTSSVDALEVILKSSPGPYQWKRLQVTNAFHCALAEPLVRPLRDVTDRLKFRDAKITLEACTKGSDSQSITPALITSHIREPVYFHEAVERIVEELGPCTWIEAGMGTGAPVLRRALGTRASSHDIKSNNLDSTFSIKSLAKTTSELWDAGIEVQFWPFHQAQRHQYEALNLPPYQFDKSRHWLDWKDLTSPAVEVQQLASVPTSPLQLVRKSNEEGEFRINTQNEVWQKTFPEYRVHELSICPLSSLLSFVSEAINTIRNTETLKIESYSLRQITIQKLTPAESEIELYLKVIGIDHLQSWKFEISDPLNSSKAYVSGIMSAIDQSIKSEFARFQRLVDINRIKEISYDNEADSVKGKAVYKSFGNSFQFPESRRVIKEVSCKGNEAIGYMVSQTSDWFVAVENIFQVPLLCVNGLRDRRNDEVYIVTALEHVKVNSTLDLSPDVNPSWVVYAKFFKSDDTVTTCDIFLFDVRTEELFAVILDVTLSKVRIDLLQQTLGGVVTPPEPTATNYLISSENLKCPTPDTSRVAEAEESPLGHTSTRANPLPDITKSLFDLLSRVADVEPDTLHIDATVIDLGIDSLMAMDVTEEINKYFSIKIDIAETTITTTLGSLCELIASKTSDFSYVSDTNTKTSSDVMVESDTTAPTSVASDVESFSGADESEPTGHPYSHRRAVDKPSVVVLEAFDAIREEFDVFAKETGCDQFWSQVYPAQMDLVVSYTLKAFAQLGCDLCFTKTGEKIPTVSHSPRNVMLVNQLMHALQENGLVAQGTSGWTRTSKSLPVSSSSSEKYNRLLAEFPQFATDHALLHLIGPNLFECLSDKVNPLKLLFGSAEKRKLMAEFYSTSPILYSTSQQLCSFIRKCFSSRIVDQPFRILEIGGGTCGTSSYVVDTFSQLDITVDYTFSDVSPSFVSAAKSKLARYKFVNYRTVDITKIPEPDMRNYYDMIIATNVMHTTPDVHKSARNAFQMLRSDGFLILVENTRLLYSLDFIFGQLDGWWSFEDGREYAIMDENRWKTTLQSAGFKEVDWTEGRTRESEISKIFLAY